jgi:hypothetical protein
LKTLLSFPMYLEILPVKADINASITRVTESSLLYVPARRFRTAEPAVIRTNFP